MTFISSNEKTDKPVKGYVLQIMQLAPATVANIKLADGTKLDTCKDARGDCAQTCIFFSGRGEMPAVWQARVQRTHDLFMPDGTANPVAVAKLHLEISKLHASAKRKRKRLALRLNGFSDLDFVELLGSDFFSTWKDVQFYDYTKHYHRWLRYLRGELPANYDLTFSISEKHTLEEILPIVQQKHARPARCATVSRTPETMIDGITYVDGDKHDATFTHPTGTVLVLSAKGKGGSRNPKASSFIPA
jgi:hypothetical protein